MLEIQIEFPDGRQHTLQAPDDCGIGKGAHNEVRLDSWRERGLSKRVMEQIGRIAERLL